MRVQYLILVALTLFAGVAADAEGRTWRVERDGTGDFTTIQPAVDAASPGDVIEIGPGRFDEWHHPAGHPQWFTFVYVTKSLTFVGAGVGETIIGPDDIFDFTYNDFVVGIMAWGSDLVLSVRDLTFENIIERGIHIATGRVEIERCEFHRCVFGIYALVPQGGWIRDCQFHDNGVWGIETGTSVLAYQPSVGLQVENCTFTHNWGGAVGTYWSVHL